MKIAVVTPLYAISGVPLAQLRFARALAGQGHAVDLIIGHVGSDYVLPQMQPVRVQVWNHQRVLDMFFPLVRYLRRAKPEVVFSAEDHLNTVVLLAAVLAGSKARISGSSRVTPFDTYSNRLFSKRWVLKQAARLVMGRADALTCVSADMVAQYRRVFTNPPHVCVYNIVDDRAARQRMAEPVSHPWLERREMPVLVAAGRLAPWKGFGDLIAAMTLVTQSRSARLLILGDGPLRAELQDAIARHGLSECVQLLGYVDNPLKYFANADAFVLSSHVEGMPNVLVEAMMCGCTPVATDCPTGPRELLQNGRYGYLVPMRDPEALAAGMLRALDHPIPPARLAEAVKPFEEHAVIDRHFEILGLRG